MDKKGVSLIVGAVLVIGIAALAYFYFRPEEEKPPLSSAQEAASEVKEVIPEIITNPVEDRVPEINPVDKTNPFKYENPLR